ncbi:class II glutamine amidotransferase [Streptomyces scopuliridis]|uniref:class II glutamine amidotransferase n=1 Tax=Streptomyces scopuliridis TaxID=452529 RepID=UPI0036C8D67E
MCRHLARLGPPVALGEVLVAPPHALFRQSWAPRRQRNGTVNADGFGVGWYADGDPLPARYRRARPIWGDLGFADLARVVRTGALLAAVRDATEPGADGEAAAAPFADGPWLFSHNGSVGGWPGSLAALAASLPAEELLTLAARNDSALVWALLLHRLRAGDEPGPVRRSFAGPRRLAPHLAALSESPKYGRAIHNADPPPCDAPPWPERHRGTPCTRLPRADPRISAGQALGQALGDTVLDVAAAAPASRLNLLLTDGERIAATAWGDTLWYLTDPGGHRTVVASEPYDDDARWREVPDRTLLVATRDDVLLSPLKEPPE